MKKNNYQNHNKTMWLYKKKQQLNRTVRPTIFYQLITLPYQNVDEGFFGVYFFLREKCFGIFFFRTVLAAVQIL